MRHNSKRPTEYYRCFDQVPTTLSTPLLVEIKLLWIGLASGKGTQLLWSYCQQYVLYLSQASEYSGAARFPQHSQHIHDGWRGAIPDPPSGSAGSSRTGSTAHVRPQTPNPLLPQTSRSAATGCLLGEGQELTPSPWYPPYCSVTCESNHRGQQLTQIAARSIPEGWELSQDMNNTQPRCPSPRGLMASKQSKIYFTQCDTCSPGRLEKQKHVSRRAESLLSARLCLCSISSKISPRTAAPNTW